MTKNEERQLDVLFQTIGLLQEPKSFISGKRAECRHHYKQGRGYAIRWYLKGGFSVTAEEHNEWHNDKGAEYDNKVDKKLRYYLTRRKGTPVKYLKYETVLEYFNGMISDYI